MTQPAPRSLEDWLSPASPAVEDLITYVWAKMRIAHTRISELAEAADLADIRQELAPYVTRIRLEANHNHREWRDGTRRNDDG